MGWQEKRSIINRWLIWMCFIAPLTLTEDTLAGLWMAQDDKGKPTGDVWVREELDVLAGVI